MTTLTLNSPSTPGKSLAFTAKLPSDLMGVSTIRTRLSTSIPFSAKTFESSVFVIVPNSFPFDPTLLENSSVKDESSFATAVAASLSAFTFLEILLRSPQHFQEF